ncbi:cell envelope integrity protein TolA [Nisaea sp.]|uniref:cell envelope integrity protein TolA n=1 Tax=Nisaea sp. TaxID=2024842 RepID=UPI003266F108
MRTGLSISVGIHVAVFAFAWFGLPELRNDDILPEQLVIVDMVDISEITNTPTAAVEPETMEKPKPKEPNPEAPKPAPPPPEAAAPSPPPPPTSTPEPAPEPVAEVPEPEPAPIPKPAPEKAPEPKKVAQAPTPAPKPRPKPRAPEPTPKEAEKKPKKDDKKLDFSRLLKTLEKTEPAQPVKPQEEKPKKNTDPLKDVLAKLQAPARSRSDKAFDPENKVSISEIDAVRRQIAQCWNVPAGAKDAENLFIEIALQMGADGTVRDARIVDQARLSRDGFFRSAAESARRAVLSCGKLPLPPEKYESWKNITMTFNPRDLL